MDITYKEIRPKMIDSLGIFDHPSIKDIILFYVARRLKSQSGTLVHLYNMMGSLKNYYIALKIWDEIEEIINCGGNYLNVFKTVVFSDSYIANYVFFHHVKNTFLGCENSVQLQFLTKIPHDFRLEINNTYDIAIEAETRLKLEWLLREGATSDQVFDIFCQYHRLPNQWESIEYKAKTKEELIKEAINNHLSKSNDLPLLTILGKGRKLLALDLIKEGIFSSSTDVKLKH